MTGSLSPNQSGRDVSGRLELGWNLAGTRLEPGWNPAAPLSADVSCSRAAAADQSALYTW